MQPVIYVDLRCLQDKDYRRRGIGYHVTALLRSRQRSAFSGWQTIGLTDPQMAPLLPEFTALVDETTSSVNPCCTGAPTLFIDGSPMTHDPRFSARFDNHSAFLRAAVLYDFIPLDWPGFLPTVAKRIEYVSKLARLKKFHLFFPISQYTAWRLSELLGVPRAQVNVTGASVRRSLYELHENLRPTGSPYDRPEPYFVTLGGDDRRKNTEAAIKAVQRLNLLYGRRIPLKVIGFYCDAYKHDLLQLAGHAEGAGFVELYPSIPDEEVVSLHAGAIAAIAPSYIEGFSLPVAEAAVCECPVIASTCAAQMELVEQAEALFPPDDAVVLSEKLETLMHNPALRASLVASQAHLAGKFHEGAVGDRFWSTLASAVESRRNLTVTSRRRWPRLAFLSPYLPDESGAGFYTEMVMRAGRELFHSNLYTDAVRPLTMDGTFGDADVITAGPVLGGRYDAVISVLGNSAGHSRIFEVFERYGGPCILHDVRLTQIYFQRLGQDKFIEFATALLGRPVSSEEVNNWLRDQKPASLFLEKIIERASPLIVNTMTQQALIKQRYGVDAHVTTCCPSMFFNDDELTTARKRAARERHGITSDAFLISSFGSVSRENGMDTCIVAVELLRSWNIPAEFYFIGNAGPCSGEADRVSGLYGIAGHVHSGPGFEDDAAYRDFLIASDAAVQLRPYEFGRPPALVCNCISAALPCVAAHHLAESCDAPEYVLTVPDRFSPLQVAEQLAVIWETQARLTSRVEARAAYLQTHNFQHYAKRLIEILGIA